jgi:hypothetical protein
LGNGVARRKTSVHWLVHKEHVIFVSPTVISRINLPIILRRPRLVQPQRPNAFKQGPHATSPRSSTYPQDKRPQLRTGLSIPKEPIKHSVIIRAIPWMYCLCDLKTWIWALMKLTGIGHIGHQR